MRRLISIALLATAGGLAACGSTPTESDEPTLEEALADPRVGEQTDSLCFSRGISGFRSWDGPDGLILRKGASREYLVLVQKSCRTLDNAQLLGVDQRFSPSGCLRRNDNLFISDRVFLSGDDPFAVDRCRVLAIYEWDEDAAEAADAAE